MKNYLTIVLLGFVCCILSAQVGKDVEAVFRRAAAGAPLRAVFIGGSITQDGKGWIGEWLEKTFPESPVVVHNVGMSATGSSLGVFRLHRDVIARQPDLVFLEFAVNDGGMKDEPAIRFLESIVVRLKSLRNPPAVVFLETAAKNKSNRARHHAVAEHYGLLEIDLQVALDSHLSKNRIPWERLMGDSVHPNRKGHAFYGEVIAGKLAPFAERARRSPDPRASVSVKLPEPMSAKPLLLDADMQTFPDGKGWTKTFSVGHWWDMFLQGTVRSSGKGAEMHIPFRGTVVGVMFAMSPKYGKFLASVDGGFPKEVRTNTRYGYSMVLLADHLTPGEHMLSILVPEGEKEVHLAYLLTAGGSEQGGNPLPGKKFTSRLVTEVLPAKVWELSGPYGTEHICVDGPTPALNTVYPPEPGSGKSGAVWKKLSGEEEFVDLFRRTGQKNRGVNYVRTTIHCETERHVTLGVTLDYFGKVWLNGKLLKVFDSMHGGVREPVMIPVVLKKGENELLLKVHAGSAGNEFSASLNTLK